MNKIFTLYSENNPTFIDLEKVSTIDNFECYHTYYMPGEGVVSHLVTEADGTYVSFIVDGIQKTVRFDSDKLAKPVQVVVSGDDGMLSSQDVFDISGIIDHYNQFVKAWIRVKNQ